MEAGFAATRVSAQVARIEREQTERTEKAGVSGETPNTATGTVAPESGYRIN
jgi:hypothetical protein